jgi:hypothetical protein
MPLTRTRKRNSRSPRTENSRVDRFIISRTVGFSRCYDSTRSSFMFFNFVVYVIIISLSVAFGNDCMIVVCVVKWLQIIMSFCIINILPDSMVPLSVVMCTARLQAVGQAKPSPIRPSRAGPKSRPDNGFGLAWDSGKPKPSAQAAAF